ncbi:DUF6677 family protein [Marinobacter lacisalsi]|uniref:DUF6677 family protein n=1 Tax=Marinobacter lacisalsi TaxID=475979 RepID=A0ABV8QCP7_9GAMM
MSKTTKAVLLSAFIMPGAGHFFLKRNVTGALFLVVSLVCLYVIVAAAIAISQEISARILSGDIPLDIPGIQEAISNQRSGAAFQDANGAGLLLMGIWLLGILDAFRVGRFQSPGESGRSPRNPTEESHQG